MLTHRAHHSMSCLRLSIHRNYSRKIDRLVLLIFAWTSLASCAASGSGPPFELQLAGAAEVVVYHYREKRFTGSGIAYDVLANRTPLTTIGNGGFFRQSTKPGTIVYHTKYNGSGIPVLFVMVDNFLAEFEEMYTLTAEAGETYFLRWKPHAITPQIDQVSQQEAMSALSGLNAFPAARIAE